MTVERLNLGRKNVVVGIRLDDHSKELLDWALVKVADPGDNVVAIHVCRNSDCIAKGRGVLDEYLEDYQGLCLRKQVALSTQLLKGNSIRKVLVREAIKCGASAVLVGITKHSSLGGWGSVAKYCAKRLPHSTQVISIHNGKVVFSRSSMSHLQGLGDDPKPSFCLSSHHKFRDYRSEFGESEVSEMSSLSCDERDDSIGSKDEIIGCSARQKRSSLHSISLPAEDFTKQRPGWPLLQTTSTTTQPALQARKLSVVQWVMNLPHRSLQDTSIRDESINHQELPKDLKLILSKNKACCQVFSYDFLKICTHEFSSENLIGKGGCNSVYKGILPKGRMIAVKIQESSKEGWKDFIRDIDIMTTVKHKRISPLIGVCVENSNNLISVYEYLPKGNLEKNLHDKNRMNKPVLSWEVRFKIAVEVAEALNYLHNECPRPVIHRDVKSSNILLTDELEPQLSDFGLAIWGPTTASFLTDSDVVGTFGYLAPEYFMYGKVSEKIDVYAFGVVLLELLSGKKAIGLEKAKEQESLVMWAKLELDRNGGLKRILDPNLHGSINEVELQRMGVAATSCLTQAARLRPKMSQILKILNGEEHKKAHDGDDDDSEDHNDDEVYPNSCAESHLSVALLVDVNENWRWLGSMDESSSSSPGSLDWMHT